MKGGNMPKGMAEILIDKGHELQETYDGLLQQRAANRRSLKDLDVQGLLTDEEAQAVEELYPQRERKTEEERLAEAREKVAKLEAA